MFSLQSLFQSFIFITIITIIVGLGLATIFGVECNQKDRNCNVYHPPEINDLDQRTLQWNDQCYLFEKKDVVCPLHQTQGKEVLF